MRAQRLFIASLLLAVLAVAVQFQAMNQTGLGIQAIAKAARLPQAERDAARSLARRQIEQGAFIQRIGALIATVSAGFVLASGRKQEPAWRSLTFATLGFYVLTQFLLV